MATTRCGPRRPPPAPRSQRDTLSTDEPALAQLAAGQACRWPRVWGQSPARPRGPRSRPALCAAPSPRTRACRAPHVPEALGARAGVCSTGASPELLPLLDTSSTLCAGPAPAGALDTARKPQPRPELRASVLRDRRTRATGSHWRRGSSDYSSRLTLTGPASCSLVPGGGPSAGRRGAGHTLSSGSPSAPSAATDACVPGHVPQTGGRRGAQAWTVGLDRGPGRPVAAPLPAFGPLHRTSQDFRSRRQHMASGCRAAKSTSLRPVQETPWVPRSPHGDGRRIGERWGPQLHTHATQHALCPEPPSWDAAGPELRVRTRARPTCRPWRRGGAPRGAGVRVWAPSRVVSDTGTPPHAARDPQVPLQKPLEGAGLRPARASRACLLRIVLTGVRLPVLRPPPAASGAGLPPGREIRGASRLRGPAGRGRSGPGTGSSAGPASTVGPGPATPHTGLCPGALVQRGSGTASPSDPGGPA